ERRYDDDLCVTIGLFVKESAEVLRNGIGAPARRVQAPEEHVPVRAELFERQHASRRGDRRPPYVGKLRLSRWPASPGERVQGSARRRARCRSNALARGFPGIRRRRL